MTLGVGRFETAVAFDFFSSNSNAYICLDEKEKKCIVLKQYIYLQLLLLYLQLLQLITIHFNSDLFHPCSLQPDYLGVYC